MTFLTEAADGKLSLDQVNERVKPTENVRCLFLEGHGLVDLSVSGVGPLDLTLALGLLVSRESSRRLGNGCSSLAKELAAPYVSKDPDVVELQGNGTSGFREALRLPLRCEVVQPEQSFLVWLGQPTAQEMLLGLQHLCRSG